VKSFETDVIEDRCAPVRVVCRCVSTADSSLSLSLSLCSWLSSAENGSSTGLLAGHRRAFERGFRTAWRRPLTTAAPLACARASNELGRAPHNPWSASEEALSCVPSRAGVVAHNRRGPVPNPGPRRSLLFGSPARRGLLERRVPMFPVGVVAFEEVPSRTPMRAGVVSGERPGPSDLGSRRLVVSSRRVLQHAPVVAHAERRGPTDPGSRRSSRAAMGGASLRPYRSRETLAFDRSGETLAHPPFGQHPRFGQLAPRRPGRFLVDAGVGEVC